MAQTPCVCGHSPTIAKVRAEIVDRLDAIKKRRLDMASELGRLVHEEQTLRVRLERLAYEN